MTDYVIVLTTVDSEETAAKISRSAVEAGVAASGQVSGPVATTYRHLGQVCEGREWQVMFRTATDRVADLERHVTAQHPYGSPEIISLPITSGPAAYLEWITRATR